jgi:class 3 adenylate cyclase
MSNDADSSGPAQPALERRLATILSADVAGYTRLMGTDEEATVQALRGHRAVFDALLRQHHGRVFNTAGDAILAEFPSAVEAVRCATEIQAALQTRNAHLPAEQKMLFRMGINLGDVVVQEGDLLGDGVNVASRIQTVAEPGGICISGSVYDQIQNKLSLQFKPLGERQFKNVGQPIRTFTITHGEAGALPAGAQRANRKAIAVAVLAAIVASALAAGGYSLYREYEAKRVEQAALTAQLGAERQAAEDARRKADEQSRRAAEAENKAERERLVAESTKREAALQSQLQSAEGARARAEADRKRLDEERQRIEEQKRATEARAAEARAAEEKRAAEENSAAQGRGREARKGRAASAAALETGKASPANSTRAATGATAFDGAYAGQICNNPADAAKSVCWQVPLKVENGTASAAWARRLIGKSSSVSIAIAADGAASATLDGWNVKADAPMAGAMNGRAADNRIDLEGRWAPGLRVAGHWTRKQ